jgi:hypothetical protein
MHNYRRFHTSYIRPSNTITTTVASLCPISLFPRKKMKHKVPPNSQLAHKQIQASSPAVRINNSSRRGSSRWYIATKNLITKAEDRNAQPARSIPACSTGESLHYFCATYHVTRSDLRRTRCSVVRNGLCNPPCRPQHTASPCGCAPAQILRPVQVPPA